MNDRKLAMKSTASILRHTVKTSLVLWGIFIAVTGCKKSDNFYEKLQAIPQIINDGEKAYQPSYVVDDTLTMYGVLMPEKSVITIGGITAKVTAIDSVGYVGLAGDLIDKVSILITKEMIGKNQEVKVTNGEQSTLGASIDVYDKFGPGTISSELEAVLLRSLSGKQPFFLHCQNGKGDVYYYSGANKSLIHVDKDGLETTAYDLSGTVTPAGEVITEFNAGGVDPTGKSLYFSAKAGNAYLLCKIDLASRALSVLNRSTTTSAPYEGSINDVHMLVSGIYPDSSGNLYLSIGFNKDGTASYIPDAIARYDVQSNRVSYVYNQIFSSRVQDLPGKNIKVSGRAVNLRFSPDERLLYLIQESAFDVSTVIDVFDLQSGVKVQTFNTKNSTGLSLYNVIASFSSLHINLTAGFDAGTDYGYLPMPGKRLQSLLYSEIFNKSPQEVAQLGLPKWVTFDFNEQRTYALTPGRFRLDGSYQFRGSDELLNYDENGELYTSSNGKAYLLKLKAR